LKRTDKKVRKLVIFEPHTKSPQSLPPKLEKEANVSLVGAWALKVIDKVTYIGVAKLLFISIIAKVFNDLRLKN